MGTPVLDRPRLRPRYARIGLLGLSLISATMLVFTGLVVARLPEEAGFILPMLALALVATGLVWAFDTTWARVVGIVVPLGLAVMMFWIAFGLLHPASFFDFVPAVMFLLGVGLALFGNVAAIVQRRRQHLDARATPTERHVEQAAVSLVVVAVVVSGALSLLARTSVDEAVAADAVEVEMVEFVFEPALIEVTGGAQLHVVNRDPFLHDIAVPDLGIETVDVPAGSDVLVDVPATPGTYVAYCTLHSNTADTAPDPEEQMVATLVVR